MPYLQQYASVGKQLPLYMYLAHYVYIHHGHFCPFPKMGPENLQPNERDKRHLQH